MTNSFLRTWRYKQRRIVVFGGVFDPVHKGHLQAAKEALRYGSGVWFAPERVPMHKHKPTNYNHRLAMIQAATSRFKDLGVLDYPKDHQYIKPFFTWVREQFPDTPITWMLGSDVVEHIINWPDIDALNDLGVDQILIVSRKGTFSGPIQLTNVQVKHMKTRNHHMSSSYIRDNISSRHTALPIEVQTYVQAHELYR